MKNVLVLGSRGQIGLSLINHLKKDPNKNIIECDLVFDKSHDLRKKSSFLNDLFQKADFVYFLAYDVGGSKYLNINQNSLLFLENNLLLMQNTFNYLNKYDTPFIFASSQMSKMNHSVYGTLKNIGEHYTKIMNGHIVRLWNVYGIENDPSKNHVITDFIRSAIKTNLISMITDGTETRQFLHADDCSRALINIEQNFTNLEKRYLDISSYKWTSVYEIALIISEIFDNIPINRGQMNDITQKNISIEPDSYFKKFWEPEITLKDGINKVVKHILNSR